MERRRGRGHAARSAAARLVGWQMTVPGYSTRDERVMDSANTTVADVARRAGRGLHDGAGDERRQAWLRSHANPARLLCGGARADHGQGRIARETRCRRHKRAGVGTAAYIGGGSPAAREAL